MLHQLVEVPTVPFFVEQNVDIPVIGGRGFLNDGGRQGFPSGQQRRILTSRTLIFLHPVEVFKVFPQDRVQLRFVFQLVAVVVKVYSQDEAQWRVVKQLVNWVQQPHLELLRKVFSLDRVQQPQFEMLKKILSQERVQQLGVQLRGALRRSG